MFIVGVDIAKWSHEAIVIDDSGNVVKKAFNFKNDCAGFKKLIETLNCIRPNPSDFVIGMESTAHYWLALYSGLCKSGYTVHVLNPIQSNALRGMYIRQVKNDEHDSLIVADVIRFWKIHRSRNAAFGAVWVARTVQSTFLYCRYDSRFEAKSHITVRSNFSWIRNHLYKHFRIDLIRAAPKLFHAWRNPCYWHREAYRNHRDSEP